jgi:hypothetical protein
LRVPQVKTVVLDDVEGPVAGELALVDAARLAPGMQDRAVGTIPLVPDDVPDARAGLDDVGLSRTTIGKIQG